MYPSVNSIPVEAPFTRRLCSTTHLASSPGSFDTITISGSAVNWTKSQTLAEVSEWNFDLSGSGPALTWENGTNDFSGDTLNLTFGGAYTGGVVFSGSGATLTGWESVGAVNIGGSAAVRDGSVWRVAGAWELSRNADNQLILSKLA